ncbi:MAG: acyl-CoA dehydrogenase [Comamonadaceae bacterium]|nr:MAG: acyl-CoA dehydrogenase [Comamonadaceae bacterium]
MHQFKFEPVQLPDTSEGLRQRVRSFLAAEKAKGSFHPAESSWISFDPSFSRRCGEAGLIGLSWPKKYGGHEMSTLEKYVVTEELLAGGAPVGAHWIADRQSGNQILRFGSERARELILPKIVRGECFFGIGMSEPNSGSDLAAVSTRARKVDKGWSVTGTKVWTSNAHRAHYLIALIRTESKTEARHAGLTQFVIDLSHPGVTVRPIHNLYGGHEFNEVVFNEYFVADDMVVGEVGNGWAMVTGELAYERSGPDRFLSSYQLLLESMRDIGPEPDDRSANEIGRFVAHLAALRRMSTSIAGMLDRGEEPVVEAALVKDIGTTFEREIPEVFRHLIEIEPTQREGSSYAELQGMTVLRAPGFTIRGGTREILRGMIARGLGLR